MQSSHPLVLTDPGFDSALPIFFQSILWARSKAYAVTTASGLAG